jgi:hypothetical protein
MNYFLDSEENEQQARDSLLKYYSSESLAHGTYILAVAIGVFTFLQTIPVANDNIHGIWLSGYITLMTCSFAYVGAYFFVRTLFWGILTSAAMEAMPMSHADLAKHPDSKSDKEYFPIIVRIHYRCIEEFRQHHRVINFLNSAKRLFFLVFIPLLILVIIHLSIPHIQI